MFGIIGGIVMVMSNIKENIRILKKQRDDKKYERKLLATDYENHKDLVKKSGITALITLLVYYVILLPLTHYKKHVTLMGLGRFLIPFALIIFLVSFIYFLVKGFDLFVNAENKYSKMMAEKFNINSVSDELRLMNESITMMDIEINRLENELYESGEDFNLNEDEVKEDKFNDNNVVSDEKNIMQESVFNKEETKKEPTENVEQKNAPVKRYRINLVSDKESKSDVVKEEIVISASEKVERPIVERIVIEKNMTGESENTQPDTEDILSGIESDEDLRKKNSSSIDDIFNGLDEYMLEEDEDDDFESSSDMWEKDAMRRFSKM